MADYIFMMETRLTPEQQRGVSLVRDVARAHDMNIYLAGGVVRDIISGASIRDLDFALQGNPLKLQKDLEKAGAIVEGADENLKSLYLLLPGNLRGELAAARAEVYDKPGRPPETTPGTINEDLRRRDFTANAMALSLNPGSRGLLLDPFNGVADIEAKLLRILHNYSFLEDPSRLIRAARFTARYEWQLEERTLARYNAAKEGEYIESINKKLLGHEIEQLAHEPDPLKVMRALEKEGWLKVLHPHWSVAKVDVAGLNHLLKVRQQMQDLGYTVDAGPAVMYFITDKLNSTDIAALQSAIPRKSFVQAWRGLEEDAKAFAKRLTGKEAATNSQAWKMLSAARPETILFTAATSKVAPAVRKINDFFGKWREVRQRFPLPEMAPLRITPELPEYPKIVEEMFLLMLDGKLRSTNDIVKFLTPYSPPEPPPPPPPPRRGRASKKTAAAKKVQKPAEQPKQEVTVPEAGDNKLVSAAETVGAAIGKVVKAAKDVLPGGKPSKPAPSAKPATSAGSKKTAPKKASAKRTAGASTKKKSVKKKSAGKAKARARR